AKGPLPRDQLPRGHRPGLPLHIQVLPPMAAEFPTSFFRRKKRSNKFRVSNPYILRSIWFPYKHSFLSFSCRNEFVKLPIQFVLFRLSLHASFDTLSHACLFLSLRRRNYDSFFIFNNIADARMTHSMTHTL